MEAASSVRADDGKVQIDVELTAEEVGSHIKSHFKELGKNRIPGFRQGRAPRKVIEQNFGGHDYIYAQITSDVVNDFAPKACDRVDVVFISDPEFDNKEMGHVEDGESYSFYFYGEVKPSLDLESSDPVEIKMPPEEATDAEIDVQIKVLQEYYADFEGVERAVKSDDFILGSIDVEIGGKKIDRLSVHERLIEVSGSTLPSSISAELIGMEAGQTKEFEVMFGADELPDLAGKTAQVKATVDAVRERVLPDLDDEFAGKMGFDSYEKFREEIRDELQTQKDAQLPAIKERRAVNALSKRAQGEISESYVNYTREDLLREFFNRLQQQGTTFDQFLSSNGISSEEFQKDLAEQAQEHAREALALDALFEAQNMELTDDDIDQEFEAVGDPSVTRQAWEEAGRMAELREALRRQKATKWLVDTAVVEIDESAGKEESDGDADDSAKSDASKAKTAKSKTAKCKTAKSKAAKSKAAKDEADKEVEQEEKDVK